MKTTYLLTATTADDTVHTAIDGKAHESLAAAMSSYNRYANESSYRADCGDIGGFVPSNVRTLSITRKVS